MELTLIDWEGEYNENNDGYFVLRKEEEICLIEMTLLCISKMKGQHKSISRGVIWFYLCSIELALVNVFNVFPYCTSLSVNSQQDIMHIWFLLFKSIQKNFE